jgi:hypothetical protein
MSLSSPHKGFPHGDFGREPAPVRPAFGRRSRNRATKDAMRPVEHPQ